MKKLILLVLVLVCSSSRLFALRPGDRAQELVGVKMLRGENIDLTPAAKNRNPPPLRAVVFLLCRAVNSETTVAMLDDLQRAYRDLLHIEVITPDALPDAEALLRSRGNVGIAFGLDADRKITREYMAGSLLYPMAFLIDRRGVILWCGEAVDMAEKIPPALSDKLSVSDEAEIAELVSELQQLLRDNSETKMKRIADRIFSIEPGNAAAMRLRLFTLENTGRIAQAGTLINEQLKAAPGLARLYFTAVDFGARHGCSDAELERIVSAFERRISDAETRVRMGDRKRHV